MRFAASGGRTTIPCPGKKLPRRPDAMTCMFAVLITTRVAACFLTVVICVRWLRISKKRTDQPWSAVSEAGFSLIQSGTIPFFGPVYIRNSNSLVLIVATLEPSSKEANLLGVMWRLQATTQCCCRVILADSPAFTCSLLLRSNNDARRKPHACRFAYPGLPS